MDVFSKSIQRKLFEVKEDNQSIKDIISKDTFENGLLLVKSYLLSHGYKETLSKIDKEYVSDNLLNSPEKKSSFRLGIFGRRSKRKKTQEENKLEKKDIWSMDEKKEMYTLLVHKKDFENVKKMLNQKKELTAELKLNLDLRIFLKDYYSLGDENQKIIRLEQEKDMFSFYRDSKIIGCPNLKCKVVYWF